MTFKMIMDMPMMARGLTTMSRPTMSRITIMDRMPIMMTCGETVMMSMTHSYHGPACLRNLRWIRLAVE